MSRSHNVLSSVVCAVSISVEGCVPSLQQEPLARAIHLPVFQGGIPQHSPISSESASFSLKPLLPETPSTGSPTQSPTLVVAATIGVPVVFPPLTPYEPPTAWIEDGLGDTSASVVEQEAPQKPFLEEAHMLSVGMTGVIGTKSVAVRIHTEAPQVLTAYRVREKNYGSFDREGVARVDVVGEKALFTTTKQGDYLLTGREVYVPQDSINIPAMEPTAESVTLESNVVDSSTLAIQSVQRRRIASTVPSLHVKNYLNEKQFVLRPVILFLHGMGERNPQKLWKNITTYLKSTAPNKDQLRGTIFSIPLYDTLQAIHVSKERLKQQLLQLVGSVPIIIMCHSMGCLMARDLADDPDLKDLVVGGVMLAGANGSPWMPKSRMRPSIADQPDSTALLAAQTLALAKTMPNITETLFQSKSLPSLVRALDEGMTSKGALSLATARDDIPTRTYQLRLNVGIYPFPLQETLTADDAFTLPCSDQYFPQKPRDTRIRYGSCFANFARELRIWEHEQKLDNVPRWYAYAGLFRGNELRSARTTFLQRLTSMEAIIRFMTDTTGPMDEEALRFAASLLADRITKDGVLKRFSDGLVDPEDAWLLEDGPSIESPLSERDNLVVDQSIVQRRLPRDIIAARAFYRSHREIVVGLSPNDHELFTPIAQDIGALLSAYRSQGDAYVDSELDSVRSEIEKSYHMVQGSYDSSGRVVAVKTTTVQFRPPVFCGQDAPCVDVPYDVIQIYDNRTVNRQTITVLKSESRRAYRVWRAWRLFDG